MKVARFVLKIVALSLAVGATACAIIAYWDKIMDCFYNVADKLEEKRANCCFGHSEYDDYDDGWDNA